MKKHASQEKRLDKAEQSKKAFIKQWLRSVSAANASSGRSDDDDEDGESAGYDEVVGSVEEEEGVGVDCCVEGSEVGVDVEDGVGGGDGDDVVEVVDVGGAADEVVEVVLDKPRPPPPPLPILTMPTTPIPATMNHNATTSNYNYNVNNNNNNNNNNNGSNKRGNNHRRGGCVRYLNLRESGYTPAEEKMFLVSSLVLRPGCGSPNRPGRRRSSPAQSVLGSAADSSPPVDVIMIGSSDASGEASVIMDGERMDEDEDGEDEDEEIQVVETWPWPTPAPTTPTTQRTTTPGTVKQRTSSHGSLSTRSNTGNTTGSAARRRALKRARLKNRIRILGGAKTGANGAPLAPPPGEGGVCGETRTGVIMPRLRTGRRARPGA